MGSNGNPCESRIVFEGVQMNQDEPTQEELEIKEKRNLFLSQFTIGCQVIFTFALLLTAICFFLKIGGVEKAFALFELVGLSGIVLGCFIFLLSLFVNIRANLSRKRKEVVSKEDIKSTVLLSRFAILLYVFQCVFYLIVYLCNI
jgi:hypothetical protein